MESAILELRDKVGLDRITALAEGKRRRIEQGTEKDRRGIEKGPGGGTPPTGKSS